MQKEVTGDYSKRARVAEWHKRFSEGWGQTEDDKSPGQPVTAKNSESKDSKTNFS